MDDTEVPTQGHLWVWGESQASSWLSQRPNFYEQNSSASFFHTSRIAASARKCEIAYLHPLDVSVTLPLGCISRCWERLASLGWGLLEDFSSAVEKWCERPLKLRGTYTAVWMCSLWLRQKQAGTLPANVLKDPTSQGLQPGRQTHFSVGVNSTTFGLFQSHLLVLWKYIASSFLKLSLPVLPERQIKLHLTGIHSTGKDCVHGLL